jgi:3'(2'), 5'-bisphosphate nucleotidase
MNNILLLAIKAAIEAGKETLKYYGTSIEVEYKTDDSPLTKADIDSNTVINKYLQETNIPILSEENEQITYAARKDWEKLWVIDPLDGTKEFINNSKEYTVNIALINKGIPVLGVVYVPVLDVLFFGEKGVGAFKLVKAGEIKQLDASLLTKSLQLPLITNQDKTVVVASRLHRNAETDGFISRIKQQLPNIEIKSYGSSLKLCMIAEGSAHIYPRLAPTMEWDIAASHAIIEAAGSKLVNFKNLSTIGYNKENLLNEWFIAYTMDKEVFIKEAQKEV